jgi:hypothetical protein
VIKHDIHATCFIRAYSFNQDITTKLDGSGSLEKIFCGIRRWLVVLSLVTHPFARQASRVLPVAPFGISTPQNSNFPTGKGIACFG